METRTLLRLCWLFTLTASVMTQSCVSPTTSCDCFIETNRKIINCRYRSLTEIPTFTPSTEVYDEIRFDSTEDTGTCVSGCNNITTLNADAFANLTVKVINLKKNPLTMVDPYAFDSLKSVLEGLYLEGDGNNDPPYSAMAPLENLLTLHLENYASTVIQTPAVLPFPELQSLTLKKWPRLQTLQNSVFSVMKKLKAFNLQYLGSMVNLPVPTIQTFLQLTSIDVMETGISSVLGEVFSPLNSLTEVKIRSNMNLVSIDDRAFYGVTDTIEFLDLDGNQLNSVSFLTNSHWSKLSHLNIGYNANLRTLPVGIFNTMATMDYLQIQQIGLESINEAMFTNLSNLHTIDLSYNKIQTIGSGTFRHSPRLVEVRLDHQITMTPITFQENAFNNTESSLEILNLNEDKLNLDQLWTDLTKLTNLKVLELENTSIEIIPNMTFTKLTTISTLNLARNKISDVYQETFFGPKNTLRVIDLSENKIKTIGSCVLSDFPSKPSLHLNGNNLRCDCDLVWLFDWFQTDPKSETKYLIGPCSTPQALANKFFDEFTRTDMCSSGAPIPTCPDLYATTTTSTTTTTTTTKPTTTTTEVPTPVFDLIVNNAADTFIEVTWTILDKTDVDGIKIEITSNYAPKTVINLGVEETSYTAQKLRPDNHYSFCLILKINGVYRENEPKCKYAKTRPAYTEAPVSTTVAPPKSEAQLGVIVGASVGGVVLVALIIAIVVVLLKSNKPKKKKQPSEPISFTLRADIPHEGGTAKRFAKKPDKDGTSPDDIGITVISNGDMSNRDRISAGSYQTLNEKGIDHRPMPGSSHGHYTNSVEDRPLPKAPKGASNWSGGATGHGYVNTDNKNQHLPESSKNEYSEVRY